MRDFCFGPRFRPALLGQFLTGLALFVPALAGIDGAAGQQIPQSLQQSLGTDQAEIERHNNWTVTIAAGAPDETSMRFADELSRALNDGDDLRVLPVVSRSPGGSVEDLLHLNDIDIAVTQADVLEYFRVERKTPLANRIQYVAELPAADVHVAARESVHSVEELRGQKVVFGPAGGAAAITGPILFRRLGIAVKPVFTGLPAGLDLVKSGEAAAILTVDPKPSDLWVRVPPYAGLHFLPAPYGKAVADLYGGSMLTAKDYPNLIAPNERIETLAVTGVLAVQNMPKTDDRFRRVLRFVQYLSAHWDRLRQRPFHPGWREASLTATLPGWTRFSPSEVFRQFLLWREQQQYSRRQ
jgi:TRAP-type uncharacterized transport system substrate-binding protein